MIVLTVLSEGSSRYRQNDNHNTNSMELMALSQGSCCSKWNLDCQNRAQSTVTVELLAMSDTQRCQNRAGDFVRLDDLSLLPRHCVADASTEINLFTGESTHCHHSRTCLKGEKILAVFSSQLGPPSHRNQSDAVASASKRLCSSSSKDNLPVRPNSISCGHVSMERNEHVRDRTLKQTRNTPYKDRNKKNLCRKLMARKKIKNQIVLSPDLGILSSRATLCQDSCSHRPLRQSAAPSRDSCKKHCHSPPHPLFLPTTKPLKKTPEFSEIINRHLMK